MNWLQILIFALASAGVGWVSRGSLRRPAAHGFYRVWAWEAILALVILQLPRWFRNPFRPRQLLSWIFLCLSLVPLVLGLRSLSRAGRPSAAREDAGLVSLEKTTALVTSGIFGYIRHPLYASLLLLAWGAFLKAPRTVTGVLAGAASGLLWATAKVEERENVAYFGASYEDYMRRTRRFVPFLFYS